MFQTGNDVPASDLVRGAHDRSVLTTAMEIEGSDRWDQAKWDRLRRDLKYCRYVWTVLKSRGVICCEYNEWDEYMQAVEIFERIAQGHNLDEKLSDGNTAHGASDLVDRSVRSTDVRGVLSPDDGISPDGEASSRRKDESTPLLNCTPAAEVVPQLLDLMQDTGDFEYGMWKPFEEMTPDEQHDQLSQMSYLALRANVRMMKMTQVVKERDAGGREGIRK